MLHAIYQRVEVGGSGEFLDLKLTPEAERYGLSLALPEQVSVEQAFGADAVLACPRGLGPPDAARMIHLPIAGRNRWLQAAREGIA